jgi:hypothetical protein
MNPRLRLAVLPQTPLAKVSLAEVSPTKVSLTQTPGSRKFYPRPGLPLPVFLPFATAAEAARWLDLQTWPIP